jgi:CheY-like chemotaxis protein
MKRARILIVEDERLTAMSLQCELRALGYDVAALISSGEEAVARATELRPDLVLMDVRLEGAMSGIEAARQIRSFLDIPVIFLTAYSNEDIRRSAERAGSCGYILKPYEQHELQEALDAALGTLASVTKGDEP